MNLVNTTTYRKSNGDLEDLDAFDLRQHLAAYVAQHGWDVYAENVHLRLVALTDLPAAYVRAETNADVAFLKAGAR